MQGPNISVMQQAMADQIMNYTPIVHVGQSETIIQNVDMTTPLYIFTPGAPVTIQIPANENTVPASLIEIPMQHDVVNEVSEFNSQKNSNSLSTTLADSIRCSVDHQSK